jgi:CheY-like chemotaxis protein
MLSPTAIPHPREEHFSVLVVDDHPLLREAIAARLRSMGAGIVHEAASVAEARARAQANGPCDLAILDLGLPDGSGLELMKTLRDTYGMKGIALSGFGTDEDIAASVAAGFTAHLTKPIDWERLRAEIERLAPAPDSATRSAA